MTPNEIIKRRHVPDPGRALVYVATATRSQTSRVGRVLWLLLMVGMWIAFLIALFANRLDDLWRWARDLPLPLELGLWLLTFPWILGTAIWESSWDAWLRVALVSAFAVGWTLVSVPRASK
jgi:hypothetical protein